MRIGEDGLVRNIDTLPPGLPPAQRRQPTHVESNHLIFWQPVLGPPVVGMAWPVPPLLLKQRDDAEATDESQELLGLLAARPGIAGYEPVDRQVCAEDRHQNGRQFFAWVFRQV